MSGRIEQGSPNHSASFNHSNNQGASCSTRKKTHNVADSRLQGRHHSHHESPRAKKIRISNDQCPFTHEEQRDINQRLKDAFAVYFSEGKRTVQSLLAEDNIVKFNHINIINTLVRIAKILDRYKNNTAIKNDFSDPIKFLLQSAKASIYYFDHKDLASLACATSKMQNDLELFNLIADRLVCIDSLGKSPISKCHGKLLSMIMNGFTTVGLVRTDLLEAIESELFRIDGSEATKLSQSSMFSLVTFANGFRSRQNGNLFYAIAKEILRKSKSMTECSIANLIMIIKCFNNLQTDKKDLLNLKIEILKLVTKQLQSIPYFRMDLCSEEDRKIITEAIQTSNSNSFRWAIPGSFPVSSPSGNNNSYERERTEEPSVPQPMPEGPRNDQSFPDRAEPSTPGATVCEEPADVNNNPSSNNKNALNQNPGKQGKLDNLLSVAMMNCGKDNSQPIENVLTQDNISNFDANNTSKALVYIVELIYSSRNPVAKSIELDTYTEALIKKAKQTIQTFDSSNLSDLVSSTSKIIEDLELFEIVASELVGDHDSKKGKLHTCTIAELKKITAGFAQRRVKNIDLFDAIASDLLERLKNRNDLTKEDIVTARKINDDFLRLGMQNTQLFRAVFDVKLNN